MLDLPRQLGPRRHYAYIQLRALSEPPAAYLPLLQQAASKGAAASDGDSNNTDDARLAGGVQDTLQAAGCAVQLRLPGAARGCATAEAAQDMSTQCTGSGSAAATQAPNLRSGCSLQHLDQPYKLQGPFQEERSQNQPDFGLWGLGPACFEVQQPELQGDVPGAETSTFPAAARQRAVYVDLRAASLSRQQGDGSGQGVECTDSRPCLVADGSQQMVEPNQEHGAAASSRRLSAGGNQHQGQGPAGTVQMPHPALVRATAVPDSIHATRLPLPRSISRPLQAAPSNRPSLAPNSRLTGNGNGAARTNTGACVTRGSGALQAGGTSGMQLPRASVSTSQARTAQLTREVRVGAGCVLVVSQGR